MTQPARLARCIAQLSAALHGGVPEADRIAAASGPLRELVAQDDWLPESMAQSHPVYYQQHLLHCDPAQRFCLVSVVWGPGQGTPIHDHTTWGVIGMLRGAEISQAYAVDEGIPKAVGSPERLEPGMLCAVSPLIGDVHEVRNAFDDRVSISIHLYGADIGKIERHAFDAATGAVKTFVSGYSNRLGFAS